MASHHHLQGCCHPSATTTSTVCCSCSSCNHGYVTPCHNPPPPDPHFHHHLFPSTQPHPQYSTFSNSPYVATQSFHLLPADFQREDYCGELYNHKRSGLNRSHPVISSLIRRIAALETTLRHQAASRSQSLRDAAARTIQTYFRAFLVRRSRTLSQLKDLASIKSAINVLKSSVSDNNPPDPLALSHKALQLLLKLDSIQGDDPMIRDGKRSIDAELTRFLDFIDGVTVKRSEFSGGFVRKNARQGESSKKSRGLYSNKKMDNRDLGRDRRLEDLVSRIEALYNKVPLQEDGEEDEEVESPRTSLNGKNGVIRFRNGGFKKGTDDTQVRVKKNVKFSEDGNVYYVPRNRNGLVLVEDFDGDDGTDLLNAKKELGLLRRKAEEVEGISCKDNQGDEVGQSDDSDSDDGDGERDPTYSAPLPVRMESRSDFMDKRNTSKLVE